MISAQSLHSFTWPFACHLATPKKETCHNCCCSSCCCFCCWVEQTHYAIFPLHAPSHSFLCLSLTPPFFFFCLSLRQFLLQFAHCGGFSLRSKCKGRRMCRSGGKGTWLTFAYSSSEFYLYFVSSFIQIIQIVVVAVVAYLACCCCCNFTLCTFSILNFVLMLRKFILSIERNFCCFLFLLVDVAYFGFYFTHTHTQHEGEGGATLCVAAGSVIIHVNSVLLYKFFSSFLPLSHDALAFASRTQLKQLQASATY